MRSLAIAILCALLPIHAAHAEWQLDGNILHPNANASASIPDGSGGAIVSWSVFTTSYDVYVQRVDKNGVPMWTPGGVVLCAAAGDQTNPLLASDGAGGAIVVWEDARSGTTDIYARRINAAGVPQWTADGVALCAAANGQYYPEIVPDGSGGAVAAWIDLRAGAGFDIYARRVNSAGTSQWTANGVAVCTATGGQTSAKLIPDGGGAIITWTDSRGANADIYAQRLNSAGAVQWAANGIVVCGATNHQLAPQIVTDGGGGAIIAWQDLRTPADAYDIFAQRVNASGTVQWALDGNAICASPGDQNGPVMISDGAGGAIAAWQDARGIDFDIYAGRISANGIGLWPYNGVAVVAAIDDQLQPSLVSDGASGAVIAWSDERYDQGNIYARRVLASGLGIWTPDGSPLSSAPNAQHAPLAAGDGAGGAIVVWTDSRSGGAQVYVQRAEPRYGTWGRPEPTILATIDNPADQGGYVIVRWVASEHDRFYYPGISHYSVWRTTDAVAMHTAAAARVLTDPLQVDANFAGTAIWEEQTAAGPLYWEWVANQAAAYMDSYSMLTPTRQDSVAGIPATQYFKVVSHEQSFPQTRAWESAAVAGTSYDNLAPGAPIGLVGSPSPWQITLTWSTENTPADFDHFAVYRGSTTVLPTPPYLIGTTDDLHLVDDSVPAGPLRYIVTAIDVHGNQSAPSNMWSPDGATPVRDTPSITQLTVLQNHPNPFGGTTDLRIGLPAASNVSIEVYDVAGRRVSTQSLAQQSAGWKNISFDGRNDAGQPLSSGVYFYKVTANGTTVTNKMVIAR